MGKEVEMIRSRLDGVGLFVVVADGRALQQNVVVHGVVQSYAP